jgi:uncharacterized protein YbjT (DUF2867 family)
MTTNTTLVLGGTGKTGRRVARRLTDLGQPVRIGSRSGEPPFDWENPATWKPALRDIDAVYISYYPDIAVPGAADTVQAFVDVAVASGVRRLVLLAGRGEESADLAEEAVRNADVEWTVVRPAMFNQNFSEDFLVVPLVDGEVVLPVGDVGEPFIDADDIAEVAVAALTEPEHTGRTYELTGPRLLTFAGAVAEIAAASGREIRFKSVSVEEYAAMLTAQEVPDDFVWLLTFLFTEVMDGRNAHLGDGVQRALGRAPKDFSDYARETAATGVWTARESADPARAA